ncbi:MAG: GNAT family N-acetyltransferase [Candidatus Helarchaeota archaeon]|nr:GNAT family N-acetyltransferase [Candidatus Helarchaeota archaeon]
MKNALREAKLKGFEKVNLSVFHTNTNAIKLYKKLGFKIVGTRKRQFKIEKHYFDEVLMDYFIE